MILIRYFDSLSNSSMICFHILWHINWDWKLEYLCDDNIWHDVVSADDVGETFYLGLAAMVPLVTNISAGDRISQLQNTVDDGHTTDTCTTQEFIKNDRSKLSSRAKIM